MSLINRLLQQISGHSRSHRTRRREWLSPFGIQAAQVQTLESRRLLSALTVTIAADSGHGSLRDEIAHAKSGDTINFASSLKGQTITLTSGELLINKGLTIQGPGASQLTISGGNHSRVFDVTASQPVVLTGLTISNGDSFQGGGIFNAGGSHLTVSACTISNSRADNGGGIYNDFGGTVTLSACNISGDSAGLGAGFYNAGRSNLTVSAISNCHVAGIVGGSGQGGGIFNEGTLAMTDCTLSGDVSDGTGDYFGGGGIFNTGTLTASGCTLSGDSATSGMGGGIYSAGGSVTLTNCTLAGDIADGYIDPGLGGGLYVSSGSASLTNCTVSLNRAVGYGGGIAVALAPVNVTLVNTIVAGNTVGTVQGSTEQARGADVFGVFSTADHNLIGNGTGANIYNGNIVGGFSSPVINAMLGPLQNNGGPTMTMALLAGSPAIGQADSGLAPLTDQRGVTRRDLPGEFTDIGAFEV